jgi:hypothetical protein
VLRRTPLITTCNHIPPAISEPIACALVGGLVLGLQPGRFCRDSR